MMKDNYPELDKNKDKIYSELNKEEKKFEETLHTGMHELEKIISKLKENIIIKRSSLLVKGKVIEEGDELL